MSTLEPQALLQHTRWLQELALHLVRDAATAEDLTQETLLSAWQARAGSMTHLRAWLGAILRNHVRMAQRRELRRLARERVAAHPETAPSSEDVVARLQEQRRVLAAVDELGEPYRTAILLRYLEQLPPRVIAARLGVPVATVHTRLKRGLAALREHFDRSYGSRRGWILAFTPLVGPTAAVPLWPVIVLMNTKSKLLVAGLLLTLGVAGIWTWQAQGVTPSVQDGMPAAAIAPDVPPGPLVPGAAERAAVRSPVAPPAAELGSAPAPASSPATRRVRGRAVDMNAAPVAGLLVEVRGAAPQHTTATGADGRFDLTVTGLAGELRAVDPRYTTLLFGEASGGGDAERVLVVAPRAPLDAVVVTADDQPIALARAQVKLPEGLRARLAMVLDYSGEEHWMAIADEQGRLAIADCPGVPGARLDVWHDGYRGTGVSLDQGTRGLRIVLRKPELNERTLSGRVVDRDGVFLPGAHVAAGEASAQSDEHGEFRLELPRDARPGKLQIAAIKRGYLPATRAVPAAPEYLILTLEGPPLAITGIVVDADDRPLVDSKVWVADPEWFGNVDGSLATREALSAGVASAAEGQRMWQELRDLSANERARAMPPDQQWHFARPDAAGRFRIEGLARRWYRVRAIDLRTLQMVEVGAIAAGSTDVRLVMPAGGVYARLEGCVVTPDGRGVAGAKVNVTCTVIQLRTEQMVMARGETGDAVLTDADGRFTLRHVPRSASLRIAGDHIDNLEWGGDRANGMEDLVGSEPGRVRIVVAPRYHLRLELAGDPTFADTVQVVDERDRALMIYRIEGTNRFGSERVPLHAGRSAALSIAANARTLLLLKNNQVVRRETLQLEPEVENVLRL